MSSVAGTAWLGSPGAPAARRPRRVLEIFIIGLILCQVALLLPGFDAGPLRVLWRVGIFAASLALIALLPGKTRSSPAAVAALWVMALLVLEVFNPTSNTWMSAVADCAMYLAVLGPLFWMSRLWIDVRLFRRALMLFWGFNSASALVGIAQVYFPGRFQPRLSPVVASMGDAVQGLKIVLANGRQIFRPMGLTDTPGGAATAGMWAVVFGLGFLLTARAGPAQTWKRGLYLASMVAGMMCIYLSQVRVLVVVVGIWFATLLGLLLWRRRWRELGQLTLLVAVIGAGGLYLSVRVGGAGVTNRLASLEGSGATTHTFSQERGIFLTQAFGRLLPRYPLGAGLGRWGMMNTYFGDNTDPRRGLIYVEIQWQGWVLDGGVPLLIAYLALLGLAMLGLGRAARRRGPLWIWAALCLAYDVAMLALTFDSTPFTGEMGLEFWFVNALVLAAAACLERQAAPPQAPAWKGRVPR